MIKEIEKHIKELEFEITRVRPNTLYAEDMKAMIKLNQEVLNVLQKLS